MSFSLITDKTNRKHDIRGNSIRCYDLIVDGTANIPGGTTDIQLVGNPIHQFVSGGTGILEYRGMISPNNSISFNPTATNIEMEISLPTATESSFRVSLDSSSNTDPTTNGLIIPAGSLEFQMPLTIVDPGLGIAAPYVNDDNGDYTFNSNYIEINNSGEFDLSFSAVFIGTIDPITPIICQILRNGEAIFTGPTITSDCKMSGCDISVGPFTKAWLLAGASNCKLNAAEQLALVIQPNNAAADIVLQLSSNVSMHRCDNGAFVGPQGAQGPPGDPSPNNILINYQVPDVDFGSGNIITRIGDGAGITVVECNGTDIVISPAGGDVVLEGLRNELNGANGVFINGTVPTSTNNRYLLSFDSTTKQIERANRYLDANVTTSTIGSSANGSFTNTVTVPANTITATGQSLRFQGDYKISKTSGAPVGTIFAYGLTTALPPLGTSPSGCFSNFAAGWTVGPANITDYSMTYDCTVTCATLAVSPALSLFRVHEVINICDNDGVSPSYPAQTYVFSQGSAFQMDVGAANIFTGNISANAGSNTSFTCYLQKVWFE